MTKTAVILFILITQNVTFAFPFEEHLISANFEDHPHVFHTIDGQPIPVIFEDHQYVLHTVDEQEKYYYVEQHLKIHRFCPETETWEMDLFKAPSFIKVVHTTVHNYIFVPLRDGTIYRSLDGGNSFTLTYDWQTSGYCHSIWSINSDEQWILIGEYGPKNETRRVYASDDWGNHWKIVYETQERDGVHIHLVTIDLYTHNWWITVGDYPVSGRVLYSDNNGIQWNEVECPDTGSPWQPYQPCIILFFEQFILIINEPLPQVFRVDRKTMKAEYIADVIKLPDSGLAPPYSAAVGKYGIYASLIRQPNHNYDAGIFVSYDYGYTWHQLINFTEWAEIGYQEFSPSNIYGAHPIIYADGHIYTRWTFGWVNPNERCAFVDGGKAFKFKDAYYAPEIRKFDIVWEDNNYFVAIRSNSLVTRFKFNQIQRQIQFNVSGDSKSPGYCNLTLPKTLLQGGSWTVTIEDELTTNLIQTENTTHRFFYFTYPHTRTYHIAVKNIQRTIEAVATSETLRTSEPLLIQEALLAMILPMFVVLPIIITILAKRRLSRTPKT